jgi:hypothetical protein
VLKVAIQELLLFVQLITCTVASQVPEVPDSAHAAVIAGQHVTYF